MRIKEIEQTCSACPSQWDVITENNRYLYVRYRWGYLSVRIGLSFRDAVNGIEIYGEQIGDGLDGVISWDEVWERIKNIDEESIMMSE